MDLYLIKAFGSYVRINSSTTDRPGNEKAIDTKNTTIYCFFA